MMAINTETFSLSQIEKEAWKQISNAQSIIITSHVHPDGDAIGSVLAFMQFCRNKGKNVSIFIDDDIPEIYYFLNSVNEIKKPNKEMKADLLVILDTNPKRIGNVSKANVMHSLNIDHHSTNPRMCEYNIIRDDVSSTCEILYWIFKDENYNFDVNLANYLYTGLITDTVYFKTPEVTPDDFIIASELVKKGAEPSVIAAALETKSIEETKLVSKALSNLKNHKNGSVVGVVLNEEFDVLELTDSIIDSIRFIKGVKLAYLLKHEKDCSYRVRMRSQTYDVSSFAKANGGGGHADAAGFTINISNEIEAENFFLRELDKWLEQYSG